ncbi:MAG: hypothetical protein Q8J97_05270, partial [Flavobacteriaceae bacterium]|nr:hypothetical protein [Flavobacteriaceae bacterium]
DEGEVEEGEEGDDATQRQAGATDGAGRAAAANAQDEDEAEAEVVIVDALTLAAIFSAAVLNVCLSQPNLSTKTLTDFCAATVGHKSVIVENMVAAQAKAHEKVANEAKRRKVAIDFSWLWVRQTLPGDAGDALLPTMRSYVQRLIAAKVVPAGGISAALLTSAAAARSYVYLLWLMPKSTLKAISAAAPTEDEPAPPAEDEEEGGSGGGSKRKCVSAFLSGLLLDVRRRLARRKAGKRDLRQTPADAQGPLFPAKLEDAFDLVVADKYGARDYVPSPLVLRASDLALLMLAMAPAEFAADSFQRLLKLKLAVARAADSNSGLAHVLLHSISEVTEPAAKAIILSTPPQALEPRGAVDLYQLVSAVPEGFFNYSDLFAKQFWVEINGNAEALANIAAKHPKLHAAV